MAAIVADLQEPPELVEEFRRVLHSGEADIVMGRRTGRIDPSGSLWLSSLFWRLYRRFVVSDMPAEGVDVFACTRQVRDELLALREANSNLIALLFWLGFRRTFVPYERRARMEGRSAWTLGRKVRYAVEASSTSPTFPSRRCCCWGAPGPSRTRRERDRLRRLGLGRIPVLGVHAADAGDRFLRRPDALGLGIIGHYLWTLPANSRGRPTCRPGAVELDGRPEPAARSRSVSPESPVSGSAGRSISPVEP